MAIKPSAATEISSLVDALSGSDEVRREAAIARLAVMGPRAVERLIAAYEQARDAATRVGVLRVLERTGDRRALGVARQAVGIEGSVAVAAAGVLRALLDSPQPQVATGALDVLIGTVLDSTRPRHTRLAASDALQSAPAEVRDRVTAALQADPDFQVAPQVAPEHGGGSARVWQAALAGRLPDEPAVLRKLVGARASTAPLTSLQKLVDACRAREAATQDEITRAEWISVRGALHHALARRNSRVALYDLREALSQTTSPLPVAFLAAVHALGDSSCLEPLAIAYGRVDDAWWRQQIAAGFRVIMKREKLTRRHPVMKRIVARWPEAAEKLTVARDTGI